MDNDEPFDLTGCNVYLRIAKADGTQFQGHECCIIDNSSIVIDTSTGNGNQILAAHGINKCELHIEDENGIGITTWNFNIYVEARVHNAENILSINSYDVLDNIIDMEKDRVESEKIRQANEEQRTENESNRTNIFNQKIGETNAAITDCQLMINATNQKINSFDEEINEIVNGITDEAQSYANNAKTSETNAKNAASNAEISANTASQKASDAVASATLSQSYAVGGTQSRAGEDTDNAKFYSKKAQEALESLQRSTVTGVKGDKESAYRTGNVNLTAENIGVLPLSGGTMDLNARITTVGDGGFIAKMKDKDNDTAYLCDGIRTNTGYFGVTTDPNTGDGITVNESAMFSNVSGKDLGTVEKPWRIINGYSSYMVDKTYGLPWKIYADYGAMGVKVANFGSTTDSEDSSRYVCAWTKVNGDTKQANIGSIKISDHFITDVNGFDTTQYGLIPAWNKAVNIGRSDRLFEQVGTKNIVLNGGFELKSDVGQLKLVNTKRSSRNTPLLSVYREFIGTYKSYIDEEGITTDSQLLINSGNSSQPILQTTEQNDGSPELYYYTNMNGGSISTIRNDEETGMTKRTVFNANGLYHYDDETNSFMLILHYTNKGQCGLRLEVSGSAKSVTPTEGFNTNLGSSSYKWKEIYAHNGVIQTSDRNEKNTIEELTIEQAQSLIYGLKPSTYRMNSGTSGRTHWGMISQDIEELFDEIGMSSTDFAGFIKSPKMTEAEIDEKTGKVIKESEIIEGEYNYSLRYDEFIAPIIKVVQTQRAEIETLKQEMILLKQQMSDLLNRKENTYE